LLDRLVEQPLVRQHTAKTVVGVRLLRIDADGLLTPLGGLVVALLPAQRLCPVAEDDFAGRELT
jgi:hypothetical protein